jgi:hypothetical protein
VTEGYLTQEEFHRKSCEDLTKPLEDELAKLRKLKEKLEHYNPSLHDLLMQEIEAGR